MAKSNFTKAEEAFNERLIKMEQAKLWKEAGKDLPVKKTPELPKEALLISLQRELKKLCRNDSKIYEKVGFPKKQLKHFIENVKQLTPEDWAEVKAIKERVKEYKKELKAQLPSLSNEELIEQEARKHINKRFNINESWLPLT